jgi:hypothetical protein
LFDERVSARTERDGFYLDLGNMITGAGFITAGPGYRHHLFGGRAMFGTSAVVSVRLYRPRMPPSSCRESRATG